VGLRARLLPHDRRRGRGRAAPRPDLRDARARRGTIARTRGAPGGTAEQGISTAVRRRRALRQDGAQRHRVRADGGLRRGLQHPRHANARARRADGRRRDGAAAQSRALPIRPRTSAPSPSSGGAGSVVGLVAPRPDRRRRSRRSRRSSASPARVGFGEGAGRSPAAIDEGVPGARARGRALRALRVAGRAEFQDRLLSPCASSSAATSRRDPAS
jgi:hypothetical protein